MKYTSCIEKTHAETRAGWTLGVPILLYVVLQTISQGFWYPWYELKIFFGGYYEGKDNDSCSWNGGSWWSPGYVVQI
jgi:hypothetical protein